MAVRGMRRKATGSGVPETRGPNRVFMPLAGLLAILGLFATLAVVIFLSPQGASPQRAFLIIIPVGLFLAAVIAGYLAWARPSGRR
jgi:hypothetical protein